MLSTGLTLGLGLGLTKGGSASGVLNAVWAGQSLASQMFTEYSGAGHAAFLADVENYFNTVTSVNGATSGSAAHKDSTGDTNYWIDPDDTSDKGAAWTNFLSAIDGAFSSRKQVNTIVWIQGDTDANAIQTSALTKTQYKDAVEAIFDAMRAECGTIRIIIGKTHRRSSGARDTGQQAVRDVQEELIAEYDDVYFGFEHYHLPLSDSVHHDEEGYVTQGHLASQACANVWGRQSFGWPEASNYMLVTDTISFDVINSDGTDIINPGTTDGWRVTDDAVAATINSVARTGVLEAEVELDSTPAAGSVIQILPWYGSQPGTGTTRPDIIYDNSKLVPSYDIALGLDNVDFYIDAAASVKTLDGSNNCSSISSLVGSGALTAAAGLEPQFDATAFDGAGGLVAPDATTFMLSNADNAGATQTWVMVVEFPAVMVNSTILGVGTTTTINSFARSTTNGPDLIYGRNEASLFETLQSAVTGERAIIIYEFEDADVCNIYYNDLNITHTFDPIASYVTSARFGLFSQNGTGGLSGFKVGAAIRVMDTLSITERLNIIRYFNNRFSVGIEDGKPLRAKTFEVTI